MKLLLESWKTYLNEEVESNIWYHTTSKGSLQSIKEGGLKINSPFNYSAGSKGFVRDIYGMNPIYLSKEQEAYKGDVVLSVDTSGLPLVVDVPTIIGKFGAYLTRDRKGIKFDLNDLYFHKELYNFLTTSDIEGFKGSGLVPYDRLLNPNDPIAKGIINISKTAAVMQDIPSDKIKIIKEPPPFKWDWVDRR